MTGLQLNLFIDTRRDQSAIMKYTSTRGGVQGLTFEDALLSGYAQDGGMILPETIPRVSRDTIRAWSRLSYTQLVKEILPLFISAEEIPRSDLDGMWELNLIHHN